MYLKGIDDADVASPVASPSNCLAKHARIHRTSDSGRLASWGARCVVCVGVCVWVCVGVCVCVCVCRAEGKGRG